VLRDKGVSACGRPLQPIKITWCSNKISKVSRNTIKQVECGKILGEARAIFTNDGPIGGAKHGDGEVGAADFNDSGI